MKIYAPKSYQEYIEHNVKDLTKRTDIKIEKYPGAVLLADPLNETCGAFDRDLNFIDASLCYSAHRHQRIPKPPRASKIIMSDDDAVYCGHGVFQHFGHFLLEGMNRIYPFLDVKYKNAKFVFCPSKKVGTIPNYVIEFLTMFGIPVENIVVLKQPTRFRNVYVPRQAYNLHRWTSDAQTKTYAEIAKNAPDNGKHEKIYMSRARLGQRRTYGEEKIQQIFAKNGYTIVYPEQISLAQQIGYVKNCKYLAGCAGTALHLAAFMPAGGTVIQLKRNTTMVHPELDDNAAAQELINRTSGQKFILIWASTEAAPSIHCTNQPQIIGVNEYLKKFLDDNGFKYSSDDITPNNTEIEQYNAELATWHVRTKKTTVKRIARALIRFVCIFVPGRARRTAVRKYLQGKCGI
ncbi:glycosyltransferase family 61 protein [bacterium]|nr:glycosyltransferase family 61 protein [bacterium]